MPAKHKVSAIPGGQSIALWAGVIGAPVAWSVQLLLGYSLSQKACDGGGHGILHLITVGFIALALVGAYLSWREWKAAGGGSPEQTDGGPVARDRFLAALGLALSVLSIMVIVAQGIASFYFDGCWN